MNKITLRLLAIILLQINNYAHADFIIAIESQDINNEPLEIGPTKELSPPNPNEYRVLGSIKKVKVVGTPIFGADFKPEIYAPELPFADIMKGIVPIELAIYIHANVQINSKATFYTSEDEDWLATLERFAQQQNINVLVDWNRQIVQVIQASNNFVNNAEETVISDDTGNQYIIRKVEDDLKAASQSGYLFVNDSIYKINENKH